MKKLLNLVLLCGGLLLILVTTVIAVARAQPQTGTIPELHRCDNAICLFTIAPQKTSIDEAQAVFAQTHLFTVATFNDSTVFKQTKPFYRVDLLGESENCAKAVSHCMNEVDLVFPLDHNTLTAADVITDFGPPCAIEPYFLPGRMVLLYPGMVLFFVSNSLSTTQRFQLELPLGQINIFKNGESCDQLANKTKQYYPWRGFTVYQGKQ